MAADHLVEASVARMPLNDVLTAFRIARRFKMSVLTDRYSIALAARLTPDTIVMVGINILIIASQTHKQSIIFSIFVNFLRRLNVHWENSRAQKS